MVRGLLRSCDTSLIQTDTVLWTFQRYTIIHTFNNRLTSYSHVKWFHFLSRFRNDQHRYVAASGEMSAVLYRDMALGPIGPTPSSLLTQMPSSNMAILIFEEGAILLSPWTGAIWIRVKEGSEWPCWCCWGESRGWLRGWWRRSPGPGTTPCSASQLCVLQVMSLQAQKFTALWVCKTICIVSGDLELLKIEQLRSHFALAAGRFFLNELDFAQ
jgi:hypothetical protein